MTNPYYYIQQYLDQGLRLAENLGIVLLILLVLYTLIQLLRVKIYKLLIKSFVGPFIGTFFIAIFLLLMQTIWKYLEDLVGKGLELSVIFEFIFYFAIHLIPMALPLAILLSSIMVFGNLAEQYELVAIKSAGVSLIKVMRPMLFVSVLISVGAFFTANNLIPKANLSWGALLYDVTQKKPAMNIVPNVFFKDIDGYEIRVGEKLADNQTIRDIIIYVGDKRNGSNNNILIAKEGKMTISDDKQFMNLHLEDGRRYQELVNNPGYKKTMPHNTMEFAKYDLNIDLTELAFNRTDKERFSEDHRMMNIKELAKRIDSLENYISNKNKGLYKYLEPYFHKSSDTIDILDTSVQERFDYLLNYKDDKNISAVQVTLESSKKIKTKDFVPATKSTIDSVTAKTSLAKEKVLDRALQSANNAKRISVNNIDDASVQR